MIRAFSPEGPESERIVSPRTYAPPPSILALLVLLTLGWGVNWPIMKVVMAELPPLHFRVLCLSAEAAGHHAFHPVRLKGSRGLRRPIHGLGACRDPRLYASRVGRAARGVGSA